MQAHNTTSRDVRHAEPERVAGSMVSSSLTPSSTSILSIWNESRGFDARVASDSQAINSEVKAMSDTIQNAAVMPRLSFERRRYGTVTYTWVWAEIDGRMVSLGDPWPCVTPKRSEVLEAIGKYRERLSVGISDRVR